MYLLFHLFGFGPALAVFTVIVNRLRQVVWIATGLCLIALSGRRTALRPAPETAPPGTEPVPGAEPPSMED
jgi:hypothetical protein